MDASLRPARVVIAEDSRVDAELAIRALERRGIVADVVVATNEQDYRRALLAAPTDVIISDYSMRMMDGMLTFSIAREIAPEVPFIFLSGSVFRLAAGSEHVTSALACLDKTDLEKLGDVVAETLSNRSQPKRSD